MRTLDGEILRSNVHAFDPILRGGLFFFCNLPRVPSASADFTLGYFRWLPTGAGQNVRSCDCPGSELPSSPSQSAACAFAGWLLVELFFPTEALSF